MIISDVMDQVGDALDTIAGLRVYRYPSDDVAVPAAVVAWPESIEFDQTYARGADELVLPVYVLASAVHDRTARDLLSTYCDGAGSASVKAAIEGATYTAADSIRVASIDFDYFAMAGVEYTSARFEVMIYG